MSDDLLRIQDLILAGERESAYRELTRVFRENSSNPDAWWLLALLSPDQRMREVCLETVRKMAPDHPGLEPTGKPQSPAAHDRQPSRLFRSLRRIVKRENSADAAQG